MTRALVDTGAQKSVFSVQVARLLGLQLSDSEVLTIYGVGGSSITSYLHEVDILLLDESELSLRLPIAFSEGNLTSENLLGLDVLSFFDFGLSHHNRLGYFGFPEAGP